MVRFTAPVVESLADLKEPVFLRDGGWMHSTSWFILYDVTDGAPKVSSSYELISISVNTGKAKKSLIKNNTNIFITNLYEF